MNPEQWQKIKGLFGAALELAPAKRQRFLDNACGSETELRREVERMINLFENSKDFLERPAVGAVADLIVERKLANGRQIAHYRIISEIGAGGMGTVYLAEDTDLKREVALKFLTDEFSEDENRLRRFRQEAQTASALNHPNILTVYEIGQADGQIFIVSEFVKGETLREKLHGETLAVSEILDVTIQIATALAAAHAGGVVHRDIKPENVIIREDGLVKVLDFGLAKVTDRKSVAPEAETRAQVRTQAGMILGTAAYMSPEQARGLTVDARTDIFSLGVVLYEMLAGRQPFAGETPSDVIASILKTEPAPPDSFNPKVSPELDRIVAKTLAKDREERCQTAGDLLVDLKHLKKRIDVQTEAERMAGANERVDSPDENKTQMLAARQTFGTEYLTNQIKNSKRILAAALAVLLLAAIGLGYWFFSNRAADTTPIESIAVLPFVNESGSADVEYLSDGMTETLISSLSQIPKLNVKARSSVFRYKSKDTDTQTIGKQLNVQAVLNGRVIQRGNDLALYLELVDTQTGNQIWGEQYNRKQADLVSLQGEIARDVSQKLKIKLSGADEQRLAKNYTENPEAYQLYLKGLYHWNKLSPPEIRKSIEFFQQAVNADANFAQSYAVMGRAFFSLALTADTPSHEVYPNARAATLAALKIDDTHAEAHTTLGWIKFFNDWDSSGAEKEFQRALSLNPNLPETSIAYAHLLVFTGRYAEGLPMAQRARELDPLNLRINALEGQFLFYAGRYDDSLDRLQKTIELEPNFWLAHLFAVRVYTEKKLYREAIAEATKAEELSGGNSEAVALKIYALAKSGKREEAQAALGELKRRVAERYVPPYCVALSHNGLGETDEAIASLERGFEQRDVRMVFLKVEPKWNNLRDDARFQDLLRRVGLPQ